MSAQELLRDGAPAEALTELQAEVRKDPSNPKHRVFLFQLLSVLGQWDRALTQLKVAGEMDAAALPMVQTYREAIRCELLRSRVFKGERSPLIFGEPEQWVALMMEALRLTADGEFARSQDVRGQAFEQAPATGGSVNGQAFEWIADADSRLGPVLELIVNGRYYWAPVHRVQAIRFEEPADLRDVVWMPGEITWANGGQTVVLMPARYPDSEHSEDGLVSLGRKTEWETHEADVYVGLGQRILATDTEEYPLLDVRELILNTGEDALPAADAEDG